MRHAVKNALRISLHAIIKDALVSPKHAMGQMIAVTIATKLHHVQVQ